VLEDVSQDHARKTVCYTLNSYDILEQCHTSTHMYLYWGSKLRVVYWSRIVLIFSEVHIDKGGKGSLRYILRFCICRWLLRTTHTWQGNMHQCILAGMVQLWRRLLMFSCPVVWILKLTSMCQMSPCPFHFLLLVDICVSKEHVVGYGVASSHWFVWK
jgi:hypothetical protein